MTTAVHHPRILAVIPSRIGSTRLARKPLALLAGKPMIARVYLAARTCTAFTKVVVATDSQEIAKVVEDVDGEVVLTASDYPTGSDRVAAVAKQFPNYEIIVNLQGDEPFVEARMLEKLVEPFTAANPPEMSTLAYALDYAKDYQNPHIVKVICDQQMNALYFSRSPLPFFRGTAYTPHIPVYHHMGMYAFTADFLAKYTQLPPTPLEQAECLEQLRALEHGYKIRVSVTSGQTLEINTPEELALAQKLAEKFFGHET